MQLKSTDAADSLLQDIVIVGGGTAGWLTAAMLSLHSSAATARITVVERDDGGIGVGEATIPSILRLLQTLHADEAEFMRACDATWKLGIRFCNWLSERDIWHPFGVCGAEIDGGDLFPYWLTALARDPQKSRPYHAYSLHWAAALAGKSPHSPSELSPIAETGSYAFHLDAVKLAAWLKQRAIASGVRSVQGEVGCAQRDADHLVSSVQLTTGDSITGDFFIDCSGFNSVLADEDAAWQDWSDQLLCDRAVTISQPAPAIVPSHTQATALSAGWTWDIPLMTRRGLGYVYSSQFLSDDRALQELLQHHNISDTAAEHRILNMRIGRRQQAWRGNVLDIGLSAGFTEPLESSGLHLAQVGIETFLKLFPGHPTHGTQIALRDQYNSEMASVFDEVRDFVQLHYHLNQRAAENDPHGFWTAARDAKLSSALQHRLRLYDEAGVLSPLNPHAFGETSYFYLLSGSQRLPKRPPALALAADSERIQFVLKAIPEQNRSALRNLPVHEETLKHVHARAHAKAS